MNKKFFRSFLCVMIIGITACMLFVSITLAKYTQTVSGTDSAKVAKFSYTVKDQANNVLSKDTITQLALFETADTNVLDVVGNEKLIAPGTAGNFTITVENESEVNVDDTFELDFTNAGGLPVYFTHNGKNYSDVLTTNGVNVIDGKIADLATELSNTVNELKMINGTQDYLVSWNWDFNGKYTGQSDVIDTTLGEKTVLDTISLKISTTITQIN